MIARAFLCASVIFVFIELVSTIKYYNQTREWNLKGNRDRKKRFILFENGGVCKMKFGLSIPVDFGDKKPWRALGIALNLQAQYAVPTKPIYPWDKWDRRSLVETKRQFDEDGTYPKDESQRFAYSFIENIGNKAGKNGKQCLLRAICDNATVDETDGVLLETLRIILTPGDDAEEEYKDAYKAGRYGMICTDMYPKCPEGQGIFDHFIASEISGSWF